MKFTTEESNDVVIFALQSSLDGGPETFRLKDEIKRRVSEGQKRFLIDMEKADFVNSTAIGMLVAVQLTCAAAEAKLRFCCVGRRVARSIQATGGCIWESMTIYPDRAEALQSFDA